MSKTRKRFLYLVYMFAVTGVFLYLQFPSDTAKTYLTAHANTVDPFFRVSLEEVKPTLPLGLRVSPVRVYWKRYLAFETDLVKIVPRYTSLIGPDLELNLSGVVYGGELVCRLTIGQEQQVNLDIDLSNIQLEQLPALRTRLRSIVPGTCSGSISYRNRKGATGKSSAKFSLSNVSIRTTIRGSNIQTITINRIETDVVLEEDNLQIKNCRVNSPQGNGNFVGMIYFGEPDAQIELNLTGTIKPNQVVLATIRPLLPKELFTQISSGNKELGISIRGPLDDPIVVFNES